MGSSRPMASSPRPVSAVLQSIPATDSYNTHGRSQSVSSDSQLANKSPTSPAVRFGMPKSNSQTLGTFAPRFIKSIEHHGEYSNKGSEDPDHQQDFSGKRYVWLRDEEHAFIRGFIAQEIDSTTLMIQLDNGSLRQVHVHDVDKVNPAKFDRANDMAELTHLNEASVVHNLQTRYQSDLIYTYSGLFLVTVNPYQSLPIYDEACINLYRGRPREELKPHIYAIADCAFRKLIQDCQHQSILVTGESGAGKTENTKKVIQYLAVVATSPNTAQRHKNEANLSEQILRANPILEAFGNAQTMRNNNSSRFGKFIRIGLTKSGEITGAHIDWYLLEKSRVSSINENERNYHIFYQLLHGSDPQLKQDLLLTGSNVQTFEYTRNGNDCIDGVSDRTEWNDLLDAFRVMGFVRKDWLNVLKAVTASLMLGNVTAVKESLRADQATIPGPALDFAQKACALLGIETDAFIEGLLHPRVLAGREWVRKAQTPEQVRSSVDALARSIYERTFGDLVSQINTQLHQADRAFDESMFIGVLDIAGFEIFPKNSLEQLCINYTNEKLQQFFNHHMFVLEQEEYAREQIEWKFIDFGKDLQPAIDLIEMSNPVGIFSCLDEESVMPKATDRTFTEKLNTIWCDKTTKFRQTRLTQGFVLTHYAADVEYSTDGWLEKNKDPLNENVTRLLASSKASHIAKLFSDCGVVEDEHSFVRSKAKKSLFRTVAQRHKEQLSSLMAQLNSTNPHFVRCILPNHEKKPRKFRGPLVLDQLRCNGVLEGIRIARTGFPNRLPFSEFLQRYEVLSKNTRPSSIGFAERAASLLHQLKLDRSIYRIGLTKIFLRAGVLAELEERRDAVIRDLIGQFQSTARGFCKRRAVGKALYRNEAAAILRNNFQVYLRLKRNPWWNLFQAVRPLLGPTQTASEVKHRDAVIEKLRQRAAIDAEGVSRLEDERRRLEGDIQHVQQTLESERALALDKEAIFERLRIRDGELSERLAGAMEDQDNLEKQLDALVMSKKKSDKHAEGLRLQLEQASSMISRLESEKNNLTVHSLERDQKFQDLEMTIRAKNDKDSASVQEHEVLRSQNQMLRQKISSAESKALTAEQNADIRLAEGRKLKEEVEQKYASLKGENVDLRDQLRNLNSTSGKFEDILRRKESELSVAKVDKENLTTRCAQLESSVKWAVSQHESLQAKFRDTQAEIEATETQKTIAVREAEELKQLLNERSSVDEQANERRKILEEQLEDVKCELFEVQADLSRERQSRDDVQILGKHELQSIKEDYQHLNESKITIEKELYVQQDSMRRATEARNIAEQDRKRLQGELKSLRERYAQAETMRIETSQLAEQNLKRQAVERSNALAKDLDMKNEALTALQNERSRLSSEVQALKSLIDSSESFKVQHDQHKQRLERELVTTKGRLAASENDNRTLLNKVQQKNLEIARSQTQAADGQRSRTGQLHADKSRLEEQNKALTQQRDDSQVNIAALEKQRERLMLDLEDLRHEIGREQKASSSAQRNIATSATQIVDLKQKLDAEVKVKAKAQMEAGRFQAQVKKTEQEMAQIRQQLLKLNRTFSSQVSHPQPDWEEIAQILPSYVQLAERIQAEKGIIDQTFSNHTTTPKRSVPSDTSNSTNVATGKGLPSLQRGTLEEVDQNTLTSRDLGKQRKKFPEKPSDRQMDSRSMRKTSSNQNQPKTISKQVSAHDPNAADELVIVKQRLQLAETQNRRLQTQLQTSGPANNLLSDGHLTTPVGKDRILYRENNRLNDQLDSSAKQIAELEATLCKRDLSVADLRKESYEKLCDLINSQRESRVQLASENNRVSTDLREALNQVEDMKLQRARVEVELRDVNSELREFVENHAHADTIKAQNSQELADLQLQFEGEVARANDLESSMSLYKRRADEYFGKLEQAEIAVLKATRSQQHAKALAQESEESCANALAERKQLDSKIEELEQQNQSYEAKLEDIICDLNGANQAKKRLQHELEDYRSQRASEIEDKETTMEQTRRKYWAEYNHLSDELNVEKDNVIQTRSEMARLREQLEEVQSKWDEEVLNSSTWAKEKSRLELTMVELSASREEAVSAHDEAQKKITSLLANVSDLRISIDDAHLERDGLQREKQILDNRLKEANDRLDELARNESPTLRNAAFADREVLDLKSELAQQQDVAATAVNKMRKADALTLEMQKNINAEREANEVLHKEKAQLARTIKEMQGRIVDLEAKGLPSASQDVRFLHSRVQELEGQLEEQEAQQANSLRSVRSVDRTVRDLQAQLERRDKVVQQLNEDVGRGRDKIERLLETVDELQADEGKSQLAARRAERDLREEREKGLRLERELEGWKGLRTERGSGLRGMEQDFGGSVRGSIRGHELSGSDAGTSGGLTRMLSTSKGFL